MWQAPGRRLHFGYGDVELYMGGELGDQQRVALYVFVRSKF